jgi:hypothetical protein
MQRQLGEQQHFQPTLGVSDLWPERDGEFRVGKVAGHGPMTLFYRDSAKTPRMLLRRVGKM